MLREKTCDYNDPRCRLGSRHLGAKNPNPFLKLFGIICFLRNVRHELAKTGSCRLEALLREPAGVCIQEPRVDGLACKEGGGGTS